MTCDIDLLATFVQELQDRPPADTSLFWAKQLETFRSALATGADPGELAELLGYGFRPVARSRGGTLDDALTLLEAASKGPLRTLANLRNDAGKFPWEHMRAIAFLRREHVLDEYRDEIDALGVESVMATARHWWYARHLDRLAPPGELDILEIGAGAANLSVFLSRRGRVRSYTIVDLPEMLLSALATVSAYLPGLSIGFGPTSAETFRLVRSDDADALQSRSFDLACNFNSFMEMDREQRDSYLELIYRCVRPGGLFVNVNRRQAALPLADGGTWDNNPLLYPYRTDDQVLEWEDDPMQTSERAGFLWRPSLAVLRSARLAG